MSDDIISYYLGCLKKPDVPHIGIDDLDKNAFMTTVHKLDKSIGLNLITYIRRRYCCP